MIINHRMIRALTLTAVWALMFFAVKAKADLSADLATISPNGDGTFTFSYTITLSATERMDPGATANDTPPGTFATIYDIPGFIRANTTAANWTFSIQSLGMTPSNIAATFDGSGFPNVTFEYNGPVNAPGNTTTFSGFNIVSTDGSARNGKYASQATNNIGATAGQTDQAVGPVLVPVPEPSSLVFLGVGAAGMMVRRRLTRRFLGDGE